MKRNLILLILALLISGVAAYMHFSGPEAEEVPSAAATYSCDSGEALEVSFYEETPAPQPPPGEMPIPTGRAVLRIDEGDSVALRRTISADGGRYATEDESLIFWDKGSSALLMKNGGETSTACTNVSTP